MMPGGKSSSNIQVLKLRKHQRKRQIQSSVTAGAQIISHPQIIKQFQCRLCCSVFFSYRFSLWYCCTIYVSYNCIKCKWEIRLYERDTQASHSPQCICVRMIFERVKRREILKALKISQTVLQVARAVLWIINTFRTEILHTNSGNMLPLKP